ncbi:MAG: O-antigen ligase family protein [Candidatus Binatia bacterium]|nr:O-antigen ligase family protein [Candidatus Binatia bacterium]
MWQDRVRKWLLAFFFLALSLPVAIQQTALALLLAFLAYGWIAARVAARPLGMADAPCTPPQVSPSLSTPLNLPLLLFFAALLVSTLCSPAVLHSLAGYRKLWLVGAFFVTYSLIEDVREAEWLVSLWVAGAAVVAAYGIVQHFTGIDWARELLGKPSNLDPFWFGRHEGFRTKGLHPSGITYAHNLLFPLVMVSVLFFSPTTTRRQRLLYAGGWGLMVFALLFSLTRGVWVAYLTVLLLLGVIKGRTALPGVVAGVVLCGLFLFGAGAGVRERAWSLFDLEQNLGRSQIWQANLDMIRERPLLGWGYGNYRKFRDPYYRRYPGADTTAHAHNTFLQLWVDAGMVGLGAFLFLFGVILQRGWAAYRCLTQEPWRSMILGCILGVTGFLLGGMTQYNFGDAEAVMVMWATVGVLVRLAAETPLARRSTASVW